MASNLRGMTTAAEGAHAPTTGLEEEKDATRGGALAKPGASPESSKFCFGICRFYVTHKQRSCKFPASGPHGFCQTHASVNTSTQKKRIPCPMDPRHSIYSDHLRSHLKCCTRVRDIAWELGQPFVYEDVHLVCPSTRRVNGDPQDSSLKALSCSPEVDRKQRMAIWEDLQRSVENQPLTYDAFCQRSRDAFVQSTTRIEEHEGSDHEALDLRQLSTDPAELEQLHSAIDKLYKKSCGFLGTSPEYFLETECTGSSERLPEPGNQFHDPFALRHPPLEKDGPFEWNGCNCACCSCLPLTVQWKDSPRFRRCVNRTMETTQRQRAQTRSHGVARRGEYDQCPLKESLGVTNGNSGCFEEFPKMNKHEFQNAALLALSLEREYVKLPGASRQDDASEGTIVVEFGAGRGALTRWFRLALDPSPLPGYAAAKFILIDREKRRNKAESKSAELLTDQEDAETQVLRIRADIRDFYLAGLVQQLVGFAGAGLVPGVDGARRPPRLLTYLKAFDCLAPQHHKESIKTDRPSRQEIVSSLEEQRAVLDKLGKGGGLPIEALRAKVSQCFTHAAWSAQNTLESFKLLCLAKHLCGGATDAALLSAVETQRGLRHARQTWSSFAGTSLPFSLDTCLTIAPCCHHRCTWDALVGQAFLRSLGMNRTVFNHLVRLCGWGTGSTGLRQCIGLKLKRIIDVSRVMWLREQGFSDASLVVFVHSARVTTENVVIVGRKV